METVLKIKAPKQCCSSRDVLWHFVFIGFAVNYMVRLNLNIAIVSMVRPKLKDNISITSECIALKTMTKSRSDNGIIGNLDLANITQNLDIPSNPKLNSTFELEPDGKFFEWNEKEQGLILGSYFWLHWITQIPGGILAAKYGTKFVFGWSNFIGVFANFVIPWFAHKGALHLIFIRSIQGLCCGFSWPSMHNMVAKWIPPNERSKFITAYMGSSVGAALTYPFCGFIIELWGWEYVFYSCGILGSIWFMAWWFLVYDSPSEHPRISQEEKDYILASLGKSVSKTNVPTPWKEILTDIPLWATVIAQVGATWGLFTLMVNGPSYFKFIHGWNIRSTGLLSGMPHMFRIIFAYSFSMFGDYLLRTEKMSRSNVRKLATICCNGLSGVFMLGLAYSGCDKTTAIILLTIIVTANGAVSTGALPGLVDLSPNHSAILLGIVNTAVALVGFCTPAVVGHFTFQNQTSAQWQKVFWLCSVFLFTGCIVYVIFSKAEIASWNSPNQNSNVLETEMMVISVNDAKKKEKNGKTETQKIMYSDEAVY